MHNVSKPPKTVCMMQTELTKRAVAQIGEAIPHELGLQMINDYQSANPADTKSLHIGRNIIEAILSQPGCAGIRFYQAYNEVGEKTLVYVGVDEYNNAIVSYKTIDSKGNVSSIPAIVADRAGNSPSSSSNTEIDIWEFFS